MKKLQYEKAHKKWLDVINERAQTDGLTYDEADAVSVIYMYKRAYVS